MKKPHDINAGSMADIAFLLLVFFLVATNIDQDYAINTTISRPFDVPDSVYLVQSTLLINDNGEYMINNKKSTKEQLSIRLSREFDKREQVKNVLLVKSDREVAFDDFLTALDQSKAAFKLFYNDLAKQKYALDYADLADSLQVQLKQRHPIALAEDVIE
ncbi:MAG: biopolymer transporter ExbD [Bacteroidia bacterium]